MRRRQGNVLGCAPWLRDGWAGSGSRPGNTLLAREGLPEGVGWSPNQVAPGWVEKPRSMPPLPLWLWVGRCRIRKHAEREGCLHGGQNGPRWLLPGGLRGDLRL